MSVLSDFVHRWSCHQWTKTVLFLHSWFGYLSFSLTSLARNLSTVLANLSTFYFFFLFYCIGKNFQYVVEKTSERELSCPVLHLSGKVSSFSQLTMLAVGVLDILYQGVTYLFLVYLQFSS